MPNLVGKRLGPYQIIEELGRGGMAVVYKAWQPDLERYVALKVLNQELSREKGFIERFLEEGKIIARLKHSNIVQVYDVGQADGSYYLAMEYIAGRTLQMIIAETAPLPRQQVASIVLQIAKALDYAHRAGIIHRDVKPSNIMVDQNGHATLTDFGIARALEGTRFTRTGAMVGTPEYMSPEQVRGVDVTPLSDVYSLGVVCHELLKGEPPFTGDTISVLYKIVHEKSPKVQYGETRVRLAVNAVLDKALQKKPKDRYASAIALADALQQALSGEMPAGTRPSHWKLMAGVAAILAVVLLVVSVVFNNSTESVYPRISRLSSSFLEAQGQAMIPDARIELAEMTRLTRYEMDITVQPVGERIRVDGQEQVLYTNNSGVSLPEIYLHLYPNSSAFGNGRAGGGRLDITHVAVDGRTAEFDTNPSDRLRVLLSPVLPPDHQAKLTIDFIVTIPHLENGVQATFNSDADITALASFYPMVAIFTDSGLQTYDPRGWDFQALPDFRSVGITNRVAFYTVRLRIPEEMKAVTSGSTIAEEKTEGPFKMLTIVTGPMRDFAVVMSESFEAVERMSGDGSDLTIIHSFYLPEHQQQGRDAADYALGAFSTYSEMFGRYPYAELDIVEAPTEFLFMEYPGLAAIGKSFYILEKGVRTQAESTVLAVPGYDKTEWSYEELDKIMAWPMATLEFVAANLVAKQWWYAVVGNDQTRQPWLDEALAHYSTFLYYEATQGSKRAGEVLEAEFIEQYEAARKAGYDAVVNSPASNFDDNTQFNQIVQAKGGLFFHWLRTKLDNDTAFAAMLHTYYQEYRFEEVTEKEFLAVARRFTGDYLDLLYGRCIASVEDPCEPIN